MASWVKAASRRKGYYADPHPQGPHQAKLGAELGALAGVMETTGGAPRPLRPCCLAQALRRRSAKATGQRLQTISGMSWDKAVEAEEITSGGAGAAGGSLRQPQGFHFLQLQGECRGSSRHLRDQDKT